MIDPALREELSRISTTGAKFLFERLAAHGIFDTSVAELAADASIAQRDATQLLDTLVDAGVLVPSQRTTCGRCNEPLSPDDKECPRCGHDLIDPVSVVVATYRWERPHGRDVPWLLLIHGMNTRGDWQEQFVWRAAIMHGRSIPVFSFKYGVIRPGVLLPWRRRKLVNRTICMIRELAGDTHQIRLGERPDVIAHSFGTWLIVQALITDPALKIGRLVLTGSIVDPEFDWREVASQHQGVLNHRATNDRVVGLAAPFIPDSGPSGKLGFVESGLVQEHVSRGWGHSDYFDAQHLPSAFREIWSPFLRLPVLEEATTDGTSSLTTSRAK